MNVIRLYLNTATHYFCRVMMGTSGNLDKKNAGADADAPSALPEPDARTAVVHGVTVSDLRFF